MSTTETDIKRERDETLHAMGECDSLCEVCNDGEECLGCGKLTLGSTSAAGVRWVRICQPCTDLADRAAQASLRMQAAALTRMADALNMPRSGS